MRNFCTQKFGGASCGAGTKARMGTINAHYQTDSLIARDTLVYLWQNCFLDSG